MLHNIEFKLFPFYNNYDDNNKTLLESSHDDHLCRDICQQYKKMKTKWTAAADAASIYL